MCSLGLHLNSTVQYQNDTPSAPCKLHFFHFSSRNSFGFRHDWLEISHRLHFVQKIFCVYTLYVQKLPYGFHLLSRGNSKLGPCHRNYASVQFQAGSKWLSSHSKAKMQAHMMMLKQKENSWNSLFHSCPNMVLSLGFFDVELSGACSMHPAMVKWI